jgi:hypothetical protein
MNSTNWEDYTAYNKAWTVPAGPKRNDILNRFLSLKLPPAIFKDKARIAAAKAVIKARNYAAFKKTPAYTKRIKQAVRLNRARRSEACHQDIKWVLGQFDCNIDLGIIHRPNVYVNPKTGYHQCSIWGKTYQVHRLIWMWAHKAFVPAGMTIDHIDNNKANNKISNLQLMTLGDNIRKFNTGKYGWAKKRSRMLRGWEVMKFYYAQPHGFKMINTMAEFGMPSGSINLWINTFSEFMIKSGKREYYINSELNRRGYAKP